MTNLGTTRELVGTDAHNYLAESHIRIVKLTALKLWQDVQRQKLQSTQDDCVAEAAMAQNLLLSYNGVCPAQALLGIPPRNLYDPGSDTLDSYLGAIEHPTDAVECALCLRLMAKDVIIQSIIEDRITRANNTRIQQHDIQK